MRQKEVDTREPGLDESASGPAPSLTDLGGVTPGLAGTAPSGLPRTGKMDQDRAGPRLVFTSCVFLLLQTNGCFPPTLSSCLPASSLPVPLGRPGLARASLPGRQMRQSSSDGQMWPHCLDLALLLFCDLGQIA